MNDGTTRSFYCCLNAVLRAHVKAEIERWSPIIAKAGVYAD
jgi:hypothetical protein